MDGNRVSFVVDFVDDRVTATLSGNELWKRKFAAVPESRRCEAVEQLRRDAHRGLDEIFHLLAFLGDADVVEHLPTRHGPTPPPERQT
jgi:hypothetical protein